PPTRSKRTDGRRPASARCRHSSTSLTQAPASLPSSWKVRDARLSWTVIRSIAHTLSCSLESKNTTATGGGLTRQGPRDAPQQSEQPPDQDATQGEGRDSVPTPRHAEVDSAD